MGESAPLHQSDLVRQRKEKIVSFLKEHTSWIWYLPLLAIVWISVYIRTRPLPGLRDITTGGWTLGPDLDPFLFLRWAKVIVQQGSLYAVDAMRYVPLGFDTREELLYHPYAIAWFHHIASWFGSVSVEQSAVLYPVVMFALTVIAFFFFVRTIFQDNFGTTKASIIALIASFFLTVVPALLPRTIAGIPEKESAAFLFMFLALYGCLSAEKAKRWIPRISFALLAGVSTAIMALTWGGFIYVFMTLGLAMLISFLLGQTTREQVAAYAIWIFSAAFIMREFSDRFGASAMLTSITTGIAFFALGVTALHLLLFNTRLSKSLEKIPHLHKIPKQLISLILLVLVGGLLGVALYGSEIITVKISDVTEHLVTPVTDRLGVTVAENRQPFYTEWSASFGPQVSGIPLFFWLFFIGSVVLYFFMLRASPLRDRILMTTGYLIFLVCLIFSRYSGESLLNGTNSYSLIFYALGFFVLSWTLGLPGTRQTPLESAYYILSGILAAVAALAWTSPSFFTVLTTHTWLSIPVGIVALLFGFLVALGIAKNEHFHKIDLGSIILFSLFFLSIVSARGAVRLIMVLVPTASILVAFLIVILWIFARNTRDELAKLIVWTLLGIVVIATLMAGLQFYRESVSTAHAYIPNPYTQQWQSAMAWVRESTPQDSVFAHWWDYGYWVQSIGERATVLDGGNAIPYWDYLMGRYALTDKDNYAALEFLYSHNVTHFLIDSTDIGKYGAFSSIGSDTTYDRRSYFTFFAAQQKQESKNASLTIYQGGGFGLDQVINYVDPNGTLITLPEGNAGLGAILVEKNHSSELINQPRGVFVYQKKGSAQPVQYTLPLRYAYVNNKFTDFGSGVEAGIFSLPAFNPQTSSIERDSVVMYLSNKTVLSQLARLYLYEENNPYFTLAHSEDDNLVQQLKSANLLNANEDFVYYQGIRGPLRIWTVTYPQGIAAKPEYLQTHYPDIALLRP